jgi:hypothetical protein
VRAAAARARAAKASVIRRVSAPGRPSAMRAPSTSATATISRTVLVMKTSSAPRRSPARSGVSTVATPRSAAMAMTCLRDA